MPRIKRVKLHSAIKAVEAAYAQGHRTLGALARHAGVTRYLARKAVQALGLQDQLQLHRGRRSAPGSGGPVPPEALQSAIQALRRRPSTAVRPLHPVEVRYEVEKLLGYPVADHTVARLLRSMNPPSRPGRPRRVTYEMLNTLYERLLPLLEQQELTLRRFEAAYNQLYGDVNPISRATMYRYFNYIRRRYMEQQT